MKTLELFSGIGGMHFALQESKLSAKIVEALDINTTANKVYLHNFPQTNVSQNNVQRITADYINRKEIELILMSPPCQPFTRQGKKMDIDDSRCLGLLHFIKILPFFKENVKYILLENVEGFQNSSTSLILNTTLKNYGYHLKEFLLTPHDFGIPNSRTRYYLLAKRSPFPNELNMESLYVSARSDSSLVGEFLEISDDSEEYNSYLLSDNLLEKRAWVLDIVTKESVKSCCFTRGYSHYIEGTGSVYCPFIGDVVRETYEREVEAKSSEEKVHLLRALRLRFFTPREIANLLCFPASFNFPKGISKKQQYRLLGNSINVKIVAKLIRSLVSDS